MEAPRVMVAGGAESPWCDEERLVRKAERERTEVGERREASQLKRQKGTGHNRCAGEELAKPGLALFCEVT